MNQEKRNQRELKRAIKKAGNRKRRQHLKQTLRDTPEEAANVDFEFGRASSAPMNGIDKDATRKRKQDGESEPDAT